VRVPLSLIAGGRTAILLITVARTRWGPPVFSLKYGVATLILIAATTAAVSLAVLWRRRPNASGVEAGSVSERWLSDMRREDES
jgi:hypothetical protein